MVRVKPHLQIALEKIAIRAVNTLGKPNLSASEVMWFTVLEAFPEIASESLKEAEEEGYPLPDEKGLDKPILKKRKR